jgi:hypothetical protein
LRSVAQVQNEAPCYAGGKAGECGGSGGNYCFGFKCGFSLNTNRIALSTALPVLA